MEPAVLPAAQGWLWVMQGFRLFRAYAALWLLLLFFYWMSLLLIGVVPILGPIASLVITPGITAGLMVASRAALAQQPPTLRHIFEPFALHRKAQLQLGLIYLAGVAIAVGASAMADGGVFFRGPASMADRAQMARNLPAYATGMTVFLAVFAPVLLAFWFAPALAHWRNMSPAKALFFSFFACLRNWRAFLVYGLGWVFFLTVVPMILATVLALLLTADMRGVTLASFIVMPYLFAVLGAVACSFYPSYAAVFPEAGDGKPNDVPPAPAAEPPVAS